MRIPDMNAPAEMAIAQCADALNAMFARQRRGFAAERYPGVAARRDRLARLVRIIEQEDLQAFDGGNVVRHETPNRAGNGWERAHGRNIRTTWLLPKASALDPPAPWARRDWLRGRPAACRSLHPPAK